VANPLKMLKLKPQGFQFIQELKVEASTQRTWDALLDVRGWFKFDPTMENKGRTLEVWPGGRFYNTLPDGTQMYYGMVTHIEPGKLLRLSGPMGNTHMPVESVYIFEIQPRGTNASLLRFGQRTYGYIDNDLAKRMKGGWGKLLPQLVALAEAGATKKSSKRKAVMA
jgi:uncharacterized protein YndB with AHSA1/START domain